MRLALRRRLLLLLGGRRRGPVIMALLLAASIPALMGASTSIAAAAVNPGVGVSPNPVQRGGTATFNWSHGGDCWDNLGHSATGNFSFQMAVWDPFTWRVDCVGGGTNSVFVDVVAPSPVGHFDQVTSDGVATGWACDGDNWGAALEIHFYGGGPAGQGIFAGSTTANVWREPGVAGNCGGVPGRSRSSNDGWASRSMPISRPSGPTRSSTSTTPC